MPPTKWQELASEAEEAQCPSAKENRSSPAVEGSGSLSSPVNANRESVLGGLRRSQRVRIEIPLHVYAYAEDQEPIFGHAKTVDVSAHGALLATSLPVEVGQTLRLVHRRTKREIECHVLRFAKRYPDGGGEVGVEFSGMSPHYWAIASPPEDWGPNWAPNALPQRPEPKVPAQSLPESTAGASLDFGAYLRLAKRILKDSSTIKRPVVVLAASAVLFSLWIAVREAGDANSAAKKALPAGVAPEDASRIPRIERTRLAPAADFDPDAISWLRGLD